MALLGIIAPCGFTGCDETWQSSTPVPREKVIADTGHNMPMPAEAKNIRYYFSGETQYWDIYLAYEDSTEDLKKSIVSELAWYEETKRKRQEGVAETYGKEPVSIESIKPLMGWYTPRWWRPDRIKHGYFIGSSDPIWGPHYWVDTDTGQVYYFEHSN